MTNKPKLILLILVLVVAGCGGKTDEKGSEPKPEGGESKNESRVSRGTNDEVIITLDGPTQKSMGLEIASLKPAELGAEIKAFGRVLDATALAASVADLETAQAASQASQAELARLKTLASQNNASQRALEAAESAARRDQAQLQAAELKLTASWGNAIARREDLPAFAQSLSTLKNALVQVDLPAAESLPGPPTEARLVGLTETNPTPAQVLGPAPAVNPQLQGQGFLLLAAPNSLKLAPGGAVTAFLTFAGAKESGVAVPSSAVVRFNGLAWVYVQTGEQSFERRAVKLDTPFESGWFVRRGLRAGDKVVVTAAQDLLSEELKREGVE